MTPKSDQRGDSPRLSILCGAGMLVLTPVSAVLTLPYIRETLGPDPVNVLGLGIMETMTVALAVMLMSVRAGRRMHILLERGRQVAKLATGDTRPQRGDVSVRD